MGATTSAFYLIWRCSSCIEHMRLVPALLGALLDLLSNILCTHWGLNSYPLNHPLPDTKLQLHSCATLAPYADDVHTLANMPSLFHI
jgi:hypothetical protein